MGAVAGKGTVVTLGPLSPLPPGYTGPVSPPLPEYLVYVRDWTDAELIERRRGLMGIPFADLRAVARKEWRI